MKMLDKKEMWKQKVLFDFKRIFAALKNLCGIKKFLRY